MLNARKQAANLLEEGTRPERLSEQWTRHIPVRGNAGDEQYGKCRLEAGKAAGEFQAARGRIVSPRAPALPLDICLNSLG